MFGNFDHPQGIVPSGDGQNDKGPSKKRSDHSFFWLLGLPFIAVMIGRWLSNWTGLFPSVLIIGIPVGILYFFYIRSEIRTRQSSEADQTPGASDDENPERRNPGAE